MKLNLKYKILLLYAVVCSAILILIGVLLSSELRKEKFTTIYRNFQHQLIHIDFALTSFFKQVEFDLNDIASNDLVRTRDDKDFTNFTEADETTFKYHIGETEQRIIDIFRLYRESHPYVNSVYMGRENGSFVRSHKRASPTRYDSRNRPWYVLGKENAGKVARTAPYTSVTSSDVNIGIIKALLDEKGQVYGVVGMDVTLINLTKYIENVQVERNGRMALIDQDGLILASADETLRFKNIKDLGDEGLKSIPDKTDGFTTFKRAAGSMYLYYYTSPDLGWKLALLIPVKEIDHEISAFVNKIVLILAISLLLLSVFTVLGLQKFVIKPLKKLYDGTEIIAGSGDLEHKIEIKSRDEIGLLTKSFNKMIATLHSSNVALQKSESELKKHRDHLEELVKERTAELRESENRLRLALKGGDLGFWDVNLQTEETIVNERWAQMLGYSTDEIKNVRKTWIESLHTDDRERVLKTGEDYRSGSIPEYEVEYRAVTKNKNIVWQISKGAIVERDEKGFPIRMIGTVMDATDRKHIEEELIKAKDAAEEATRAKSDFLANMSHEIRTPMNAVIGLTHLASQTELTPKQRDYLKKIDTSAKSLLRIINDILDFSKIEAGKLDMESVKFHLDDVLDNIADLMPVKAQEKGLEVFFKTAPDVPLLLVGDPLRLGQILINLTNNAIKFTEHGEIIVSIDLVKKMDGQAMLRFSVKDTGIGMTKEQADSLFKPFTQADTSITRRFGGTGLGLAISRRLVNMMGGEIGVETEPDKGSIFSFTAGFGLHAEEKVERTRRVGDLKGMRVLVVDDSITSQEILKSALESMSFDVTTAGSGEEALVDLEREADNNTPFELVLMDWRMPGMDGIVTSRYIKQNRKLSKTPTIIMVTAYGREEVMKKAKEAELDGFLIKPVNASVLLDTIMAVFGRKFEMQPAIKVKMGPDNKELEKLRGARVLVAEDNEINRLVAQEMLEGLGLTVTIAGNGIEAVQAVKEAPYDAVLMDIQMPEMNGFEATSEIRKDSRFKELPIIAMTAHAMAEDREKSLMAGMNDHITKPIDPDQLFSTLTKWINPGDRAVPANVAERYEGKNDIVEDILFNDLPGIDVKVGLKTASNNRKLYRDILIKFYRDYSVMTAQIKAALENGDRELAQRLAHTIKGVSGNIGARDLYKISSELETKFRHENLDEVDRLLDRFDGVLNIVMNSIKKFSKRPSVNEEKRIKPETGKPERLLELLLELAPYIKKRNPKQLKEIIEKMAGFTWPGEYDRAIVDLKKAIDGYKFKEAGEMLTSMTAKLKGDDAKND